MLVGVVFGANLWAGLIYRTFGKTYILGLFWPWPQVQRDVFKSKDSRLMDYDWDTRKFSRRARELERKRELVICGKGSESYCARALQTQRWSPARCTNWPNHSAQLLDIIILSAGYLFGLKFARRAPDHHPLLPPLSSSRIISLGFIQRKLENSLAHHGRYHDCRRRPPVGRPRL